jgi:Flp pilus assembly protein TadD
MSHKRDRHPTSTVRKPARDRQTVILAALLIAATLLVYAQVWRFGFMTVDDHAYVTANPHVQAGITRASLVWSFTAIHDANWIPFTWLSLMLDTDIYGVRPGGYHLTNVILHTANTVLLFAGLAAATGNRARSAFVAALFALHPLHVESVAWIAERKDVLSTFFGLLSLLMYVRYATGARLWNLAASLLFFVASLLSKQTLVTLPCVFLLLDFWPLSRLSLTATLWRESSTPEPPGRGTESSAVKPGAQALAGRRRTALQLIVEKIPFFVVSVIFSTIATHAQSSGGAVRAVEILPLYAREMNAVFVYVAYLWKALYPQNLAVYYPYPGPELTRTVVTLSAVFLLAITAIVIACLRRYPFLLTGWFWYLGTLVPMIGLVQIGSQQMADRYTYFPLIGVFLAVVWLVAELVPVGVLRTRVLPAVALTSLGLLAATAFDQTRLWRDNVILLRHSKDCTRDHLLAHQFLGSALLAEGALRESIAELEAAVRLGPHSASAHHSLGLALQKSGRFDEAVAQYRAALAIDDQLAEAHNNLGLLLLKRRKFADAQRHYRRALEIDETLADAHVNLAFVCLTMRDYAEAIAHARRALELNPESPTACRVCIALALRGQGRLDEAIDTLQQVVEAAPDDQIARQELARTLAMKRGTSPVFKAPK